MSRTRLPKTMPESLKFKKREVSNLNKARVHDRKAEKLKKSDDALAHVEFLERWRAIESSVDEIKKKATKELQYKLAKNPKDHELLGHLMASLSKPRQDLIFKQESIKTLNLLLNKRQPDKIIRNNEGLRDCGIDHRSYINARRDLKFNLGLQAYKASNAIALLLTMVRYACDPKTKKEKSLVKDEDVLGAANALLREIVTHIIEEMQLKNDSFFDVGDRRQRNERGIKQPLKPRMKV